MGFWKEIQHGRQIYAAGSKLLNRYKIADFWQDLIFPSLIGTILAIVLIGLGIDQYLEWFQTIMPKDPVKIHDNEIMLVIFTLGIYFILKLILVLFFYVMAAILVLLLLIVCFYFLVRLLTLLFLGSKILYWSFKGQQYLTGIQQEALSDGFVIEFSKFFMISLVGLILEFVFSFIALLTLSIPVAGFFIAPVVYANLVGWLYGYSALMIYRCRPDAPPVELSRAELAGIGSQMLPWILFLPVGGVVVSYTFACLGSTAYATGNQMLKNGEW